MLLRSLHVRGCFAVAQGSASPSRGSVMGNHTARTGQMNTNAPLMSVRMAHMTVLAIRSVLIFPLAMTVNVSGFKITSTGCEDIDECSVYGFCQQKCQNSIGGFVCSCGEGFEMRPDRRSCRAKGDSKAYLVYAHGQDVRRMDLASLEYKELARHTTSTIAVSFHYGKSTIYYSDIQRHSIRQVSFDGEDDYELFDGVKTAEGLAVDWLNGWIYWTDYDDDHVAMGSLDGKFRKVLVSEAGSLPRGIAVDPTVGVMFWTDWGKFPHISRANMDGSDVRVLVNDSDVAYWPNGIVVDVIGKYVFWCDGYTEKIVAMDYNGKNMRILVHGGIGTVFGLALYDDKIVFSEWQEGQVFIAGRLDGSHKTTLKSDVTNVKGIAVYQEQQQPTNKNPCADSKCSDGCIPSAGSPTGFVCHCPVNVPLLVDNRTCGYPDRLCNNSLCENGGDCFLTGQVTTCICAEGFGGSQCETLTGASLSGSPSPSSPPRTSSSTNPLPIALGIVFGFIAVVILVIIFIWLMRKKQSKQVNFDNPVYDAGKAPVSLKAIEKIDAESQKVPSGDPHVNGGTMTTV
eukprot:m.287153 g.287153  ORF g.287153 m.287153 type:complete len:569 (+) comp40702_c0_seq3:1382-3088(+)